MSEGQVRVGRASGPLCPVSERLASAWVDLLLRHRWEWFITLTFRDSVHVEAAEKRFAAFLAGLQSAREASRLMDGCDVGWCVARERQSRGVLHFHVLVRNVGPLRYEVVRALWREGHTWVERVKGVESVAGYCSKYVVKGGQVMIGEGVPQPSTWPARMCAWHRLRRVERALSVEDWCRLVAWVLTDGRPSRRPDDVLERARMAAVGPLQARKGPKLDWLTGEPVRGSARV